MKVCMNMPTSDHWGGPISLSSVTMSSTGAPKHSKFRFIAAARPGRSSRATPMMPYIW